MTKKKKSEEGGWEPYVMTPGEALAFLDSKGIKYEICDTPVPVLGNKVNCGLPLDSGEQMVDDYYYLPKSVVGLSPTVNIPTRGDSMIDADIHEGDLLQLEIGAVAHDGDIVIATIDGECTAKVFFIDDQKRKWLLPRNKNYDPILLSADKETRITGVVRNIVKKAPRMSFSECAAIVSFAKAKKCQEGDVFERLSKAMKGGCPLFWAASAWAVAYGVVRDCCGYDESMKEFERKAMNMTLPMNFKFVCTMGTVQRTISNHPYMRLHVDKWKENGASTREIVLAGYLKNLLL